MKYKLDNKNTTYTKEKTHFIKETTQGKSSHKSNEENTPYDDAGKTLLHDCPAFVIPLINEIFGEHYSLTDDVEFLSEEKILHINEEKTKKSLKDFNIRISGEKTGIYHVELQSTVDGTIVLRMFEYDIGYALEKSTMVNHKLIVTIAKSAIIYLRHNKNTPNAFTVEIQTPDGTISYEIPVMKAQTYTLDEIFEKKLLVLLPFYLFWYTDNLDEIEKDEEKFQKLKCEYERIKIELELLHKRKELTLYEKKTIISMTKKVVRNLTTKYPKIQKGVNEIMGGQVLMHEAKALTEKGIRIGIEMEKQNTEIEKKRADEAVKEVLMLREFIKSNGFTLDF